MPTIFSDYASFYDILYQDKDYQGESEFVRALIAKNENAHAKFSRILDLACGTGKHLFVLEEMGFEVEGSDQSLAMVDLARQSAQKRNSKAVFHHQSFQTADQIEKKFDVVLSLFASIGYLVADADLSKALRNIHGLLNPGGIFIFDFWNGNAVVRDYSPTKILRKKAGEREIIRHSETKLDRIRQLAEVQFTCMEFSLDQKMAEFSESHVVRYFFLREMEFLLFSHGFRLLYQSSMGKLDVPLEPYDWNVTMMATRK